MSAVKVLNSKIQQGTELLQAFIFSPKFVEILLKIEAIPVRMSLPFIQRSRAIGNWFTVY